MFVNVAFKRSAEGGFYNLPQVDTRPSDKHAPKLDIHTYICTYIYVFISKDDYLPLNIVPWS